MHLTLDQNWEERLLHDFDGILCAGLDDYDDTEESGLGMADKEDTESKKDRSEICDTSHIQDTGSNPFFFLLL